MGNCNTCGVETQNPSFCSLSCAIKDQHRRKPWPIGYCEKCKQVYDARSSKGGMRKYCSRSCATAENNTLKPKRKRGKRLIENCLFCNSDMSGKGIRAKYCSRMCQVEYIHNDYIRSWKKGHISGNTSAGLLSKHVKRYLREKQSGACALCHKKQWVNDIYSGPIPLEGDHISGNWRDSSEGNVRMICPTCHSTTNTYKARNKGNGREYRTT